MAFKTKLRKNDEVIVIAGSEKGKRGQILRFDSKNNRVVVKGVNVVTKHVKPNQENQKGGLETFEAPISISNVSLATTKGKNATSEHTRLAYQLKTSNGKTVKTRISTKTGKAV
ncbi:large subunit ribosomal protein L24 [Mycoplasma testudineum]|uniref:Large ribosomal subunit protein uL24 n=1 Tax=Mycoplasma testudineum TaxID=244584 RepID=A0A4R6IH00_9MOLU|nr:50S ribosomal protein L24 [Mycoplasma testudineum]OYD27155.1 50S ribosomal protein L24 [Mycoplasma testudineum]TDO21091.1 large subunit ribosomal protein L24 [Mycoplasma testudineum]